MTLILIAGLAAAALAAVVVLAVDLDLDAVRRTFRPLPLIPAARPHDGWTTPDAAGVRVVDLDVGVGLDVDLDLDLDDVQGDPAGVVERLDVEVERLDVEVERLDVDLDVEPDAAGGRRVRIIATPTADERAAGVDPGREPAADMTGVDVYAWQRRNDAVVGVTTVAGVEVEVDDADDDADADCFRFGYVVERLDADACRVRLFVGVDVVIATRGVWFSDGTGWRNVATDGSVGDCVYYRRIVVVNLRPQFGPDGATVDADADAVRVRNAGRHFNGRPTAAGRVQ